MTKIIVAGSRNFVDYELVEKTIKSNFSLDDITIFSGGANGADKLGERFAKTNNVSLKLFPAEWDNFEGVPEKAIKENRFGKKYNALAGFKRNVQMAKEGDYLLLFWDGKSKGSKHMLSIAKKYNIPTKIIKF